MANEGPKVPAVRSGRRWTAVLIGVLVLGIGGLLLVYPNAWYAFRLMRAPKPVHLLVPVQGVPARGLADTWNAPRSGGRHHQGIDIFAPKGTPIRSPVEGLVLRVGHNHLGGNIVKVLGPGAQVHYFAHLKAFGPVAEGMRVAPGDVLGYVGLSGNAVGTPPHLHYGIYDLPGGATNPYPLLAPVKGSVR